MGYVEGNLGVEINDLMEKSNMKYDEGKYDESILFFENAWDLLPGNKIKYDESYLIVWGILDIAIKIRNTEKMNQCVEKIFEADPERVDSGEREMWAGRVAFETGNKVKAMHYFELANKKIERKMLW